MDTINIFKLSNNNYYIFLKKNIIITESYLKKNFMSIKSEEVQLIKLVEEEKKSINEFKLEQLETLLWMLKYGFNNVRGSIFTDMNLSLKHFEDIRCLVKQNIKIFNKYEIKKNWESELNNCIEKEKKRHKNTTCFMCAKKGHFAIDCKELYDIDNVYISDNNRCKN